MGDPFHALDREQISVFLRTPSMKSSRCFFLPMLFAVALTACSDEKHRRIDALVAAHEPARAIRGADATAAVATPRIALLLKSLSNPYFLQMEQGARRAQAEFHAELFVRSVGSEAAIDQQIQFIEQIMEDRTADAIVLVPTDSERLVPVIARAQKAGIPVIVADTPLDDDALARQGVRPPPFVGVDNARAAYQAVRALAARLPAGSEVALVEGNSNALNARQRTQGARQAFIDAGMKLVASKSAWTIDEAYEVTGILLREHPDIRGIYCISDFLALGTMQYLADRDISRVELAGFDGIAEARAALERGQMAGLPQLPACR